MSFFHEAFRGAILKHLLVKCRGRRMAVQILKTFGVQEIEILSFENFHYVVC